MKGFPHIKLTVKHHMIVYIKNIGTSDLENMLNWSKILIFHLLPYFDPFCLSTITINLSFWGWIREEKWIFHPRGAGRYISLNTASLDEYWLQNETFTFPPIILPLKARLVISFPNSEIIWKYDFPKYLSCRGAFCYWHIN